MWWEVYIVDKVRHDPSKSSLALNQIQLIKNIQCYSYYDVSLSDVTEIKSTSCNKKNINRVQMK